MLRINLRNKPLKEDGGGASSKQLSNSVGTEPGHLIGQLIIRPCEPAAALIRSFKYCRIQL